MFRKAGKSLKDLEMLGKAGKNYKIVKSYEKLKKIVSNIEEKEKKYYVFNIYSQDRDIDSHFCIY